jgi:hypothetical protein
MAQARRCGTLGNLARHQRGEAADPMESWSPGRRARQPCRLPWVELEQNVAAGALSHGGHRFALVQSSCGTGLSLSRPPRRRRRRRQGRPRRATAVASVSGSDAPLRNRARQREPQHNGSS